jgi:hypothetical protein
MFKRKNTTGEIIKQVNYLTNSDKYNLWLFEQMTNRVNELQENLRLVYEYLGVKKMVFPELTTLVDEDTDEEEDLGCCDECGKELAPIDYVINMIDMLDDKDKKEVKKYLK